MTDSQQQQIEDQATGPVVQDGGVQGGHGQDQADATAAAMITTTVVNPDERAIKPAGAADEDIYEETQLNPDGFFSDISSQAACSVRVALRVRPLIRKESHEKEIVRAAESQNTVTIGVDKMFTFDATFGQQSSQEAVFERCVKNLVLGCFAGYNATVLAYGQTGSGKTWTMGSGYTIGLEPDQFGMIPRVIRLIFNEVEKRKKKSEFIIKCSFLEIYNEELHDLLDTKSLQHAIATGERNSKISIREEKNGSISLYGLHEEKVHNYDELASCLDRGSNSRTTASTLMNNNSSRSHAIFTISIEQHQIDDLYQNIDGGDQDQQVGESGGAAATDEFMVAKFHFVDLAGSERAKKTGAEGATLKEGININKSLLVLGNVISALSEVGKKGNFIPYRDSKLTRILQDSLGGNSRTSMIACCSPAESNFDETLNTLNYASRARKIKNKPKVNRDPNSQLIAELRMETYNLQKECVRFRSLLVLNKIEFQDMLNLPSEQELQKNEKAAKGGAAPVIPLSSAPKEFGMSGQEIRALEDEIKNLKVEKLKGEKQIQSLKVTNDSLQNQLNEQKIENLSVQQQRDGIRLQLEQMNQVLENLGHRDKVYEELEKLMQQFNKVDEEQQQASGQDDNEALNEESIVIFGKGPTILQEYQKQIQELKDDSDQKQILMNQLQNDSESLLKQSEEDQKVMEKLSLEIEQFKRNNAKLQKENIQLQNEMRQMSKGGISKHASPGGHRKSMKNDPASKKTAGRRMLTGSASFDTGMGNDEDFKHSFKRSFHMSFNTEAAQEKAEVFTKDLDEKLKNFNDKFMENLTKSLTDQLFDISKNAEEKRKQTIGQSFVEKSNNNSLIPMQFNIKNVKEKEGEKKTSPFGNLGKLGGIGSASVLVPGLNDKRTPNNSQTAGATTMKGKAEAAESDSQKLSVIQEGETETNHEAASALENVVDEHEDNKKVPITNAIKTSVISEEEAVEIMRKISQRNSMLQKSQHNSFADPNAPTKSMIDANIQPLAVQEIQEVMIVEEGDENVQENNGKADVLDQMMDEQNQDADFADVTPVEAVSDDDIAPTANEGDDEINNDELIQDITQQEAIQREEHEHQQKNMEGALLEKEKLLEHIKESQKQMQTELMDMMKNQYHSKVLELTKEITKLEKEKQHHLENPDALSQAQKKKMADQYQSKLVNLEKQLKEAKDKNKTQQVVKKQVDGQNSKIKSLEQEIQKIKVQKITTHRKWKEETEKNNKLRKQRADELLKMKKANLKKDKEIDRLKKDAKRKEVLNKRKMEEIKVLQTQKKMQVQRASSAKRQRQESKQIDVEKIKQWIRSSVDKMIEIADAEQEIKTQQEQLEKVQADIDEEVSHKASVQLIKDKLLVQKYMIEGQTEEEQDQEKLFKIERDFEKVEMEIDQYQSNIDSLTEKQDYILQKISEVSKEIVEIGMEFGSQIDKQNLQSPEGIKATVDSFFQILREASVKLRQLQLDHDKKIIDIEQLKEDLQQQQNLIEANEQYYYQKIQLIEAQCQQREQLLNQLQEEMKNEMEENKQNNGKDSIISGNSHDQNSHDKSRHNLQLHQKVLTAKEELQRNKNEAVHESMMFLKRRVAELEKSNNEHGNQVTVINNKLKASLTEKEQMKQLISQLKSQIKILNEMSSDLNMKNAIHSQIMPQSAYNSNKGTDRRQQTMQERRDMIKYYKNYKRGDRDIKLNADGQDKGDDDDGELKPSVIPVDDDMEDMADVGDENELATPNHGGRFHTEGNEANHDLTPASFVESEQEDGVDCLPDDSNDTTNYSAFFANAQERPRALTIHDTNMVGGAKASAKRPTGTRATIAPKSNNYNSNPSMPKQKPFVAKQRNVGAVHSASYQSLPQGGVSASNRRISDINQRREAKKRAGALSNNSGMIMKASERKVGMGLHISSQNTSQGGLGFRSGQQTKASMPQSLNINAGKVQETIYTQSTPKNEDHNIDEINTSDIFNDASARNMPVGNLAFGIRSQSVTLAHSPKLPSYGNWVQEKTIENAHAYQIYDITSVENLLFSTSYKNLKVWDLNEMKQKSDIKAHQGAIKCVKASFGQEDDQCDGATDSLFVTAGDKSDKTLHLWDMISLTCLATLRGHKGDIRAVEFSNDGKYIFSAGQGGMLVWDLRNTESPIELIEKKEDIFALKATDNMMFMGCRNHSIIPMGIQTGQQFGHNLLQPIVSPHWDIVTSFALLNKNRVLISASLDHNLRAWSIPQEPDESLLLLKNLSIDKAHNAHINVVEQSHDGLELYSGSRDGIVNIWNLTNGPHDDDDDLVSMSLVQSGQIQAQGSSVTAITAVAPQSTCHGKMIIYGGNDKVIRIYRDKEVGGALESQMLANSPHEFDDGEMH